MMSPDDAGRTLFTEDSEQAIALREKVINLATSQCSHHCYLQRWQHRAVLVLRAGGMDFAVVKAEGHTNKLNAGFRWAKKGANLGEADHRVLVASLGSGRPDQLHGQAA